MDQTASHMDAHDGTPPLPDGREPSPVLTELGPTPPREDDRTFNYPTLFPSPPAQVAGGREGDDATEVVETLGTNYDEEEEEPNVFDPNVSDVCPPHPCQLRRPAHDTSYPLWYAAVEGRKVGIYSRWDFREDMTESEAVRSGRVQRYPAWDFAYAHYCINYFEGHVKLLDSEAGTPTPASRRPPQNGNILGARLRDYIPYQPMIFLVTARQRAVQEPIPQPVFVPPVQEPTSMPTVPANPTNGAVATVATAPAASQNAPKGKPEVIEVSSDSEREKPVGPPKKKAKLYRKRPTPVSDSDSDDYTIPRQPPACICNCHVFGTASAASNPAPANATASTSTTANASAGPSGITAPRSTHYRRVYTDPTNRSSAATRVVRRYPRQPSGEQGGACDNLSNLKLKHRKTGGN